MRKPQLRYFLDKFSHLDLKRWLKVAGDFEAYHVRQYHYFAGQQYIRYAELLEALRSAGAISVNFNGWSRITDYEFCLQPLSPAGSLIAGGRFNVGGDIDRADMQRFSALYIAEDYSTAFMEKFGAPEVAVKKVGLTGAELALRSHESFGHFPLRGKVDGIFDLTRKKNIRAFVEIIKDIKPSKTLLADTRRLKLEGPVHISTVDELIKNLMATNWREWPTQYGLPANSQVFGRMLIDAGFTGVLYKSTKGSRRCCAIFTEMLEGSDSFIEIKGKPPKAATLIRIDGKTKFEF